MFNTYINIQWHISQTQQNFILFITVLGRHVSTLIVILRPSYDTDPYLTYPTAHFKHCYVRICILQKPEDDSVRVETCCPNTIINIIKFYRVCLIHRFIFIYKCNFHLKAKFWPFWFYKMVGIPMTLKNNICFPIKILNHGVS